MLSKKGQYAIKALAYLASKAEEGPVPIEEISRKKRIPLKFLENILLELKKAGYLDSKRGKGGGYFFKKGAEHVKLAPVIRIVDGPIAMLPCVSLYFYERCKECKEKECHIHSVFAEARDSLLEVLENRSAADLA